MNRIKIITILLASVACLYAFETRAQKQKKDNLYTAGHASAFIGGLYDAYYPYNLLKLHGDFGLGAPDKLDGELLMLEGKFYQTQSSGKTFEMPDTGHTPFAVVNFFKADKTVKGVVGASKDKLYAALDSILPDKNSIYAIRIQGGFELIKTRAFPPVTEKPYTPLAEMLPLQRFFTFESIKGDLVGYRIPAHMEGPNISGYHFHFLSADKKAGGHIIDLITGDVVIEIDHLRSFTVDLPNTEAFKNFDLTKDRSEEVRRVENGKKDE